MNILLGLIYFALAAICACLGKKDSRESRLSVGSIKATKITNCRFLSCKVSQNAEKTPCR